MVSAATPSRPLIERASPPFPYIGTFRAAPADRIRMIKAGIGADAAKRLIADLGIAQSAAFAALNLSAATVNRKALQNRKLSSDESERVVGVARLIGQVAVMVEESGDPEGFDPVAWMSRWLREPLPAFGGTRPIDLLDTMEGQTLVSKALAQMQSGAYA